jgi:hypothetical protein
VSSNADLYCFPERRCPARIGHPENRILRWIGIRVAAKISKVDEAYGIDCVIFDPLEYRAEIGARPALRFKNHGL